MDAIHSDRAAQRPFQHPLLQLFPLPPDAPDALLSLQALVEAVCDATAEPDVRADALHELIGLEHGRHQLFELGLLVDEVIHRAISGAQSPLVREQMVVREAARAVSESA